MFDTASAYAELTQPLRNLTKKNARFIWSPECEQAYHDIVTTMTQHLDPSILSSKPSML